MKISASIIHFIVLYGLGINSAIADNSLHAKESNAVSGLTVEGVFSSDFAADRIKYNLGTDLKSMFYLYSIPQNTCVVKGNSFSFNIGEQERNPYLLMSTNAKRLNGYSRSLHIFQSYPFILPKTGRVNMEIRKDTVVFSGDSIQLLQCQYDMFRHEVSKGEERIPILRKMSSMADSNFVSGNYYETLNELKNRYLDTYLGDLKVIEKYKSSLSDEVYHRLRYDCYGRLMRDFIVGVLCFKIEKGMPIGANKARLELVRFYLDNFWFKENTETEDLLIKSRSYYYSYYIYQKIYCDLFIPLKGAEANLTPTFDQVYQAILSNCPRELQDIVIGTCLLNSSIKKSIPDWAYEDAVKRVNNEEVQQMVMEMKSIRAVGQRAYNFELQDTLGKAVTLNDFRGKVVVLDFWFTGCKGCASLAMAMKPILEYYSGNDKVVFISISVDEDKKKWKGSIRKGIYTHPGSLNLYTNGEGDKNDVIKHYDIISYPTLIIIDENGNLLNVNPPRPSMANLVNSERFKNIIDAQLLKQGN